jgi:hypothetical protein
MGPSFLKRATSGAFLRAHHAVEFYEPDHFPADGIAEYLRQGLTHGEAILVVASADHQRQLRDSLRACQVNLAELEEARICTWVNVNSALAALREGGAVRTETVEELFGPTLAQSTRVTPTGRIRTYGELVSVLAESGDFSGCIQLEACWNKILRSPSMEIRSTCGYPTNIFANESSPWSVREICHLHQEIRPLMAGSQPATWLSVVVEQARALQQESGMRGRLEEDLARSQSKEIERFQQEIRDLLKSRQGPLRAANYEGRRSAAAREPSGLVKRTLKEILDYCGEVMDSRQQAAEGSAEWHKRTGEILACARLTSLLWDLEDWGEDGKGVVH